MNGTGDLMPVAPFVGDTSVAGIPRHGLPVVTVNVARPEIVEGQPGKSASTCQLMEPCGRSAVNCVPEVVPRRRGVAELTDTYTLKPVAPVTPPHCKLTGDVTLAPSRGAKSVGACELQVLVLGVEKWKVGDCVAGQVANSASTDQSTVAPSGKLALNCVLGVMAIAVGAPPLS